MTDSLARTAANAAHRAGTAAPIESVQRRVIPITLGGRR